MASTRKSINQLPVHYTGEPVSPHFRGITLGRLDNFEGGQYSNINLSSALFEARTDSNQNISLEVWHAKGRSKPTFEEAVRAHYEPLKKGDRFGPSWTNHWVKCSIKVPKEWKEKERIQLEFDPSCEAMIYNLEGLPLQGITGGFGGDRRVEFILPGKARGFTYQIYIEVTCNGMFGLGPMQGDPDFENRTFQLNSADLVVPRMEAWHLLWDFRVIKDLARTMPDNSALQHAALATANEMMNTFKHNDLSTIAKARKVAERILGQGWSEKGADIYTELKEGEPVPECFAISNCHIDTAWLWPFSATQQKVARSWSTQIDLMNRYPEHRFACSQAQQYKWLEQLYPSLFEVVKEKVASGQFQPIGGCWVEMDCNMPSGEALCRQFIYGQRYFKSRFGKICETFWLPDSFGYSSQLPQLARQAGMQNFFTQKLSWSQFNNFPRTTFKWIGLDGSQVLTHLPPVNTYTAQATVSDVKVTTSGHKSLEATSLGLLPFGNGDGGGGALAPMLESLRRIRAAADTNRELPKVDVGHSVDEFFETILKTTDNGKDLPTWSGELYLEYHRGTYTSHASIKNHNRKTEIMMLDIERLCTFASLASILGKTRSSYVYPKDEIDRMWEDVLLCQFHDVLPGSAIEMVYEDVERMYAQLATTGHKLLSAAVKALMPSSEPLKAISLEEDVFAINTLGRSRTEVIKKHGGHVVLHDSDGSGLMTRDLSISRPATVRRHDSSYMLENGVLSVTVSCEGRITSIKDLAEDREILDLNVEHGAGFVIYEDRPNNYDAWDVDIAHIETPTHLTGTVSKTEGTPLRNSVTVKVEHAGSTIDCVISLDAQLDGKNLSAARMLRFSTSAEWHTRHQVLKFEAPLAIRSDSATYETQFGTLSRPTHRNTTWDQAKFEVCAHKFADLSEFGYGVAILNENKYGYSVANNIMRLSLLRGSTYPDRHQDQGSHVISFALYPHKHHFMHSDVPQMAKEFNMPIHLHKHNSSETPRFHSPIKVSGDSNVVLETIKRGDDDDFSNSVRGEQTVILRFHDSHGGSGKAKVTVNLPVLRGVVCDLLERDMTSVEMVEAVAGESYTFEIRLKAFEVKTVKLTLDSVGSGSGSEASADDWTAI